jgi:hypothetical protein
VNEPFHKPREKKKKKKKKKRGRLVGLKKRGVGRLSSATATIL